MAVFWVVAPCSVVEVYQRFRGPCRFHLQFDELIALMMEAARTSETLVNFYQTTLRYKPEDSHLRTHRRQNLKSYKVTAEFQHTSALYERSVLSADGPSARDKLYLK
jgi:hypothetical protein